MKYKYRHKGIERVLDVDPNWSMADLEVQLKAQAGEHMYERELLDNLYQTGFKTYTGEVVRHKGSEAHYMGPSGGRTVLMQTTKYQDGITLDAVEVRIRPYNRDEDGQYGTRVSREWDPNKDDELPCDFQDCFLSPEAVSAQALGLVQKMVERLRAKQDAAAHYINEHIELLMEARRREVDLNGWLKERRY